MANLTAPVPVETEKSTFLHERKNRPPAPKTSIASLLTQNRGFIFGLALAVGFMALAFQTRASWDSHRDWVIPVTVPFWVIGGVALGHLLGRRKFSAASAGLWLLAIAIGLTALNIWRGYETEGQNGGRDAITIITAVALASSVVALLAGVIWVEAKDPTKAPPPAM